jgi:hypothetical protein
MSNQKIPTLAELHSENADAYSNDQLKTLLNCPPNMQWVKKHPLTQVAYMPIDKVEMMLDRIFGRWRREIISISQIENAVVAVVRLWYWNPSVSWVLTDANGKPIMNSNNEPIREHGEWDFHDGTGAMPIQVEKESKASDMGAIKSGAIQLAAPAAVSYALKDAADNLGKLFGRDISRKDTVAFDPSFKENPFENTAGEDKAPPQPPALPGNLATKIVTNSPVFNAASFTAPIAQQPAAVQFPDIDTKIDF